MAETSAPQQTYDAALAALPPQQRRFVAEYLVDLRGEAAAIRAGYSAKTARSQASRLLTKVNIKTAVDAGIAAFAMPQPEILYRLTRIARGSIADVLRLPEPAPEDKPTPAPDGEPTPLRDGLWSLDLVKAQRTGAVHLIKKIKAGEHGPEVELYSAHEALRDLARIQGLDKKDDGILKYLDLTKLSPAQLGRIAAGDDPLAVLLADN